MTAYAFYHLTATPLERALPRLAEKALETGKRAVVWARSEEEMDNLNQHCWTYHPQKFLPHGSRKEPHQDRQPLYLTDREGDNPNGAAVLFLTAGQALPADSPYERVIDFFNGNDPEEVAAARARWKNLQSGGHSLTYWKQDEKGGWAQEK